MHLIGKATFTTAANGDLDPTTAQFPGYTLAQNEYVTMVAVNTATHDTSEFSACKRFTGVPPVIHRVYLPLLRR